MVQCAIQCLVKAASLVAEFSDSSQISIPEELISRSQILQEAVDTAGEDGEFILATPAFGTAPSECLQAWMECASAAPDFSVVATNRATLGLLVSDWLVDQISVEALCHVLGTRLFHEKEAEAVSTTPGGDTAVQHPQGALNVQVIRQLSNDLAGSVLKAAPVTLDNLLQALPEELQPLAVHARYPSILSAATLSMDCSEHSFSILATLLHTLADTPTTFQKLSVHNIDSDALTQDSSASFVKALHAVCSTAMHASLSILSHFKRPPPTTESAMKGLMACIIGNTALQSLEIAAPGWVLRQACSESLPGISSLAFLRTAADSESAENASSIEIFIRPLCLLSLTSLNHLHMDWHATNKAAMRNIFSSLQQLQCLELSNISQGDVKWGCFLEACTGYSQLTSLKTVACKAAAAAYQCSARIQALGSLHNLCKCDLSGLPGVAGPQVHGLAQALRQLHCLEYLTLSLRSDDLQSNRLQQVLDALQEAGTARSCTKLLMTSQSKTEEYGKEMCRALQCLYNLQSLTVPIKRFTSCTESQLLDLSSCLVLLTALQLTQDLTHSFDYQFVPPGGHVITPFLQSVLPYLTNLQHLAIDRELQHASEYEAFLCALAALSSLQHLSVACRPTTTNTSCVTSTESLPQLESLTFLRLVYRADRTQPSSSHLLCNLFGPCMSSLSLLRSLDVLDSGPSEFAESLAKWLPRFTRLKRFRLNLQPCTSGGNTSLEVILASLQSLTQLQFLFVSTVMEAGAIAVACSILRDMHDLRALTLQPMGKGYELLEAVSRLTRLTSLKLPSIDSNSYEAKIREYLNPLHKLRVLHLGDIRPLGVRWLSGEAGVQQ